MNVKITKINSTRKFVGLQYNICVSHRHTLSYSLKYARTGQTMLSTLYCLLRLDLLQHFLGIVIKYILEALP